MDIVFERGSRDQPKGHALLYYSNPSEPDDVWVTYIIVLPVSVDVSKYVPPFLMNQVGDLGPKELSAFAFPPAPEPMKGRKVMERIAEKRDDDILFGGTINPSDIASAIMSVTETVQQYTEMYGQQAGGVVESDAETHEGPSGVGVSEFLYGLMSDGDKLSELTKLVSRLRFAIDGADGDLMKEAEEEIGFLARHLPENHNIPLLVEAVKSSEARGAKLADLYLQRCFYLVHEDYGKLTRIEEQIKGLEGEQAAGES